MQSIYHIFYAFSIYCSYTRSAINIKILGIYDDHNSSAALSIDGEIVCAAQEERFSKLKNDIGFPVQAVAAILQETGLKGSDLDEVAMSTIDRLDWQELKYKRDTLMS